MQFVVISPMPKVKNPLLRRKSSSPFSTAQRTKPISRQNSLLGKDDEHDRLDDVGPISYLPTLAISQDVISLMRYVLDHGFEEMPERAAGMNSEQVSSTLRFRAALPPVVSIAHLHALSTSTTDTERALARLVAMGTLRKVTIPGRGKGGSAVGEGIVIVDDWRSRLQKDDSLDMGLKDKYMALMAAYPASPTTPTTSLTDLEIRTLVTAGFLTNPAALSSNIGDLFSRPSGAAQGGISKSGYSAASGTLAAVGGHDAIHSSGGSGSTLATKDNRRPRAKFGEEMTFSLPATGNYLKLLTEARLHLLFLLKQLSPRFREATRDLLEEKWNGNVLNDPISMQKRMRGEWSGVLPGRTKRWREFYGLKYEWVLAECVGSGLVELFDTGSVGLGVRAR